MKILQNGQYHIRRRLAPDFLMIAHGPVKEAGEKGACQHLHIPVILIGSHGSQNAMAPKGRKHLRYAFIGRRLFPAVGGIAGHEKLFSLFTSSSVK